MREDRVKEFINLKQGNMFIKEYSLKFIQIARYAPEMVAEPRARMSKFVLSISKTVVEEC